MVPIPSNPRFQDLTGRTFGQITVLHFLGMLPRSTWICRCSCGKEWPVVARALTSGNTKSCGCWGRAQTTSSLTTHGKRHTPTYNVWRNMRQRCKPEHAKQYKYYAGRGIRVCERWLHSFENFLADMGEMPSPKHSLDRIDNDGHYEPLNCRWATRIEQGANKRNNIVLTLDGDAKTIAEWTRERGWPKGFINTRLRKGWSPVRALTTPRRIINSCTQ